MRIARSILSSMAAVLVVGAIANAAPHLAAHGPLSAVETPEPTETPDPTETPEPTGAPEPTETPDPTEGTGEVGGGVAPDFSGCVGLTGLENAICRHEVLLTLHPDNKGLQNSLANLQANLTNHQSGVHGHNADP